MTTTDTHSAQNRSRRRPSRTRKRIARLLAIVSVALMIPATAANAWTPPDSYTLAGPLTFTLHDVNVGEVHAACSTSLTADLHGGALNSGGTTSSTFDPCTTDAPAQCDLAVEANGLPPLPNAGWTIRGDATTQEVTFSDVDFTAILTGVNCLWAGPIDVGGSLTGDYDDSSGTITFTSAGDLSVINSTLGVFNGDPVTIDGALSVVEATIPALD